MCKKLSDYYGENVPNGLSWPHAAILALQNHKLLFCPIAKNGCTSLKRMMVSLSDLEQKRLFLKQDVHQGIDRNRTGLKLLDLDLDVAKEIMGSDQYFKFAVFRDPFERLVSAYLEKFVINRLRKPNQHHTGPVVAAVQGTDQPDFDRCITFAQFIRHITSQDPRTLDPHWKPQVLYLEGIQYDRIYRMDQLDELCDNLAARLGRPVSLEKKNVSQKSKSHVVTDAVNKYAHELKKPQAIDKRSFAENELLAAIRHYFADDYQLYQNGQAGNNVPIHTVCNSVSATDDASIRTRAGTKGSVFDSVAGSTNEPHVDDGIATEGAKLRKPLLPSDTLFFLHLPKCGGTTFNNLLQQMFRKDVEVYRNPYRRKELLETPGDELRGYRLIRGHFQYPDVVEKLGFQPRSVTILRDPIARFVSHYQMRKHPRWQSLIPAQQVYQARINSMSFEQFLNCPELVGEIANLQYKFLAGFTSEDPFCGFDQPCEDLLDQFECVGLLERFDEFLKAFCFAFDIPPIKRYLKKNVSPSGESKPQFTASTLERIAELNQHDLKLYALAQQRFDKLHRSIQVELDAYPNGLPMRERPQEDLCLDMSRVPPGNNWLESIQDPRHGCVRWTGPDCSSDLYLPLAPGIKRISLTVTRAASVGALRSLRLFVEGIEVRLKRKFKFARFPTTFSGTISGDLISDQRRTKISLRVSPSRTGWRGFETEVGVCVSEIKITQSAESLVNKVRGGQRSDAA